MTDPKSPAAGEGGEHQHLHLYVNGCYDIGTVELEGWTLISNNDLALLKAGAPSPKLHAAQITVLRRLINDYSTTATDAAFPGDLPQKEKMRRRRAASAARRALNNYLEGLAS